MRRALAWTSPLLVCACAHDFGSFEPLPEADGATDAHVVDSPGEVSKDAPAESQKEAAPDGPCTPSETCLGAAMSCAANCSETETSCEGSCGGRHFCVHGCEMAARTCDEDCVNACTSCAESAGCPAAAACQAAVPGGG